MVSHQDVPKQGESSDPPLPQPAAAEVESARLLANEARGALHAEGLQDTEIDRLADEFIAEDREGSVGTFVSWARHRVRRG
jgi:hypothetical protein